MRRNTVIIAIAVLAIFAGIGLAYLYVEREMREALPHHGADAEW